MFIPNAKVTIRHSADDGSIHESTVDALLTRCVKNEISPVPGRKVDHTLLILPPALPEAGDSIIHGEEEWEIEEVRLCYNLLGKVVASRCKIRN